MKRGILRVSEGGRVAFRCPGCGDVHSIPVGEGPGPRWGFNGDYERPTFTPSVLVRSGHFTERHQPGSDCWCTYCADDKADGLPPGFSCYLCHSFVTDGQIQFLGDCSHALAGQTVPLPDFGEGEP